MTPEILFELKSGPNLFAEIEITWDFFWHQNCFRSL